MIKFFHVVARIPPSCQPMWKRHAADITYGTQNNEFGFDYLAATISNMKKRISAKARVQLCAIVDEVDSILITDEARIATYYLWVPTARIRESLWIFTSIANELVEGEDSYKRRKAHVQSIGFYHPQRASRKSKRNSGSEISIRTKE